MTASVRVLLVDDHPLVRDGIRMRLGITDHIVVVGEAASVAEAAELAQALQPDVVVTDIRMPGASGIELVAQFAQTFPDLRIVVLSMHRDPEYVRRALDLGALAYVLKDGAAQQLLDAIDAVVQGCIYLSPGLQELLGECAPLQRSSRPITPKEAEVLHLLAQGRSSREIAQTLGASVRTIETHRLHLRRKLRVDGQAALVKYAVDYVDLTL
ncbi:response regulator transcription factor [Acidovorax sp. CCYZU-2555]|uniref:response regulator n=1 Tax=Acidovorax sp. CCYZU-2555 TaxID=2835042 RepID=UPI001BCC020E|nr:response regulator transcription factor [Acidovorax sp. CCYZU-2555]MBS7779726.1 response regulator transcription factor [Acidovorax sp. CCYZU-2555]